MTGPILSIVTGTRNRKHSYERLIRSIREHAQVPYEIVVADASNDPRYAEDAGDIRVLLERPPEGYCSGYNRAMFRCRGEFVTFLNDDCEVLPGWDSIAVDFMRKTPECAIGCIFFKDYAGRGSARHFTLQSLLKLTYANFPVMRRDWVCDIGGFDESFRFYAGDTDLSFRAIADGHAVVGIPGCKILHYREQDSQRMDNLSGALPDGELFKARWDSRAEELQQKHAKYDYLYIGRSIE